MLIKPKRQLTKYKYPPPLTNFNYCKLEEKLIYDVGMCEGGDTDYYLKKGFRVVAFEANPNCVRDAKERFHEEIESGHLSIVEGVISDSRSPKLPFYINHRNNQWGTANLFWVKRNRKVKKQDVVETYMADTVDFAERIKHFGMPYYLKIDIEGSDRVCLKALREFAIKPTYLSIEIELYRLRCIREEISLLLSLGYNRFQLVRQRSASAQTEKKDGEGLYLNHQFAVGDSGLFGKDLPDDKWISKYQLVWEYIKHYLEHKLLGLFSPLRNTRFHKFVIRLLGYHSIYEFPTWYDVHAKRI